MSFIDIDDPKKADEVVRDYEKIVQDIRKRNESKRSSSIYQSRTLEQTFAPIIKSQKNMTEEIVKSLKKDTGQETGQFFPLKSERKKRKLEEKEYGPLAEDYRKRYTLRDPDIDTQFGINFREDGQAVIGNTPITIQDDDIVIRDHVYDGTEGLWQLISERKKNNLHSYDSDDLRSYMNILRDTSVLHQSLDPNSPYPRSNSSWKWKNILGRLWKKIREDDGEDEEEASESEE